MEKAYSQTLNLMEMRQSPDHLDGAKRNKLSLPFSCGARLVLAIFAATVLILSIHNLLQLNHQNVQLKSTGSKHTNLSLHLTNLTGKMSQLIRQIITLEATQKIVQEELEMLKVGPPGEQMIAIKGVPLTFKSHHVSFEQNHLYLDTSSEDSIVFNLGLAPAEYNDQNLQHTVRFSCRYKMKKAYQDDNEKTITVHVMVRGSKLNEITLRDDGEDFLRGSFHWSTRVIKAFKFKFIPDFQGLVWDLSITVFIGNEEIFELIV